MAQVGGEGRKKSIFYFFNYISHFCNRDEIARLLLGKGDLSPQGFNHLLQDGAQIRREMGGDDRYSNPGLQDYLPAVSRRRPGQVPEFQGKAVIQGVPGY